MKPNAEQERLREIVSTANRDKEKLNVSDEDFFVAHLHETIQHQLTGGGEVYLPARPSPRLINFLMDSKIPLDWSNNKFVRVNLVKLVEMYG